MSAVSVSQIEDALYKLAEIIEVHGDAYLPLFVRLEDELVAAKSKQDALARVRAMASHRRDNMRDNMRDLSGAHDVAAAKNPRNS